MVPSPSTANTGASGSIQPRRERKGQRAADRAGDAVDQAAAHRQHALAPLGEFAAVADQHGVGIAFDEGAQGAEHFRRMQASRRARHDAPPSGGPCVERATRFGEPRRIARAHLLCRSGECLRGQGRIGDRGEREGARLFALRPLHEVAVRIDGDDAYCRIELRRGRPFDGEIERLAEQHDQVGALCEIGEARRAWRRRSRAGFP